MKIEKKKLKTIALSAAAGLGIGVVLTATFYAKNAHILKEARWTPQGDVILKFYHGRNAYLMTKPE